MRKLLTKIKRNDQSFLLTPLGDESVMMNLINRGFMGLNPVATDIWELIKEPISVESLIKQLTERYEVDKTLCTLQTEAYLGKMLNEKMLIPIAD
ncbi:PqqD family peptide modification chaperone [Emticicia fontis]